MCMSAAYLDFLLSKIIRLQQESDAFLKEMNAVGSINQEGNCNLKNTIA